ncbi:MAG TPA: PLD nuclease N-terminal domain-containing protein [Nocardioides sp.]|uniref:PLD nuclease N-terminal domain-containing protein n=1 Tax=Nocardioides sp. TaxID=35761 RepID=UPI002E30EC45|nr:PLD nuclease N-terminal domain-containing protein [Nocardioides sp.]HEX5086617.1 PLD nuclease N-terminal domain-containing protein [Nocardioides sp.]
MTLDMLVVIVAAFGVWIYALIDVLEPRDAEARTLTAGAWTPVVFFGFAPGAIAWLVVGRPSSGAPRQYDHDDLADGLDTESLESFRARLRVRAEEQRRRYAEQRRPLEDDSL